MTVAAFVAALTLSFANGTMAADTLLDPEGTISIEIVDAFDRPTKGAWYMHQGINSKGPVVRNGQGNETFEFATGVYTLRTRNVEYGQVIEMETESTLELVHEGEIAFKAVYYTDAEQKEFFNQGATESTEEEVDENVVTEPSTDVEPAEEVNPEEEMVNEPVIPAPRPDVVPDDTKPNFPSDGFVSAVTPGQNYDLAATGPSGLLGLMLISSVTGLAAIRRKND